MSKLTTLHAEMTARLSSLASLRGVVILSLDDQGYYKAIGTALADIHGVVLAIGNPGGTQEMSNVPGGQFAITVRAYVFENQQINRNRSLAATVANEAARLALTGVSAGARVHQTDVNADFWLLTAGGESNVNNWAPLLVATAILELVIRAFQLWTPSGYQTMIARGFEPGTLDELHDYVARFELRIGLDSAAVT